MRQLCKGNVAVVKGAILAGCRAYYGYPITPASEIAEAAALYLPQIGGIFLQAESEVAAINMVYGAAAAGVRVMTGSSGPGVSLMQEGMSYLAGAELPCVIVDVMRGGPGLGNIAPEQSDYFAMVKGGGHGNYRNIVLAPASVQEMASPVFYDLYDRKSEQKHQTHYCPGCGHGVAHKLIAEALQELGLQDRTIFVSPVGCSVFAYYYFDLGNVQVAHGRAPACATAIKRSCPDKVVISYQGDGDLAAIGTAEIVHAANRGEKIAVFFVNNAIYGMTGGQMAPTTLVGQKSTTSPWGRRPGNERYPLHMAELLATLEAPAYIERVALSDNKNIMKARRAVRKALEIQRDGAGFSFVEILSPCPTILGKDPVEARRWVLEKLTPTFPLNVFRDRRPEIPAGDKPPQRAVEDVLGITAKAAGRGISLPKPAHHFKDVKIKIAGFGGQGVLLLGQLLVEMGNAGGTGSELAALVWAGDAFGQRTLPCVLVERTDRFAPGLTSRCTGGHE
jgi:pyruvate/2-oxoacid:ferredoxin oxidoreductase beta subunit